MTAGDLHTLTGAYALDALTEREAAEFDRHLAVCDACAQEVRELRATAARLARAVAEEPPARLRAKVMAALPEVRQLPPEGRKVPVVSLAARRRWLRIPYLVTAACLAVTVVAGGLVLDARDDADGQRARTDRAERRANGLSALMAAPDATFRATALKGGGSGTVVVSRRLGRAAFVYHDLPTLRKAGVYELWYSRNGTMVPAGLLEPGRATGAVFLTGGPHGADGVGVTAEPRGGSDKPTSAPLAVVAL
ncbi:anti-sigma factor [Streptomyces antioxidans]|uniref:Regulator of SigK n=1 Tax=Streptomyces antioxidans TaxID=1507734 RepID=A0A1V4CU34_9ACTN|nr:anti-sigma factor [Streptomyces antioxidans]OPF70697.1 anti-sigma factor [Streptomyces antioxidans]